MDHKIKITLRNVSPHLRWRARARRSRRCATSTSKSRIEFSSDGRDLGEFRVLLGPSGCGKSTILRLIAGLDFPDSGEVLVNGHRVTGPGSDRGMVFQKYTSFAWLTVAENIEYGLRIKGTPPAERREIVAHLIDAVGSGRLRERLPAHAFRRHAAAAWPSPARWPCGRRSC